MGEARATAEVGAVELFEELVAALHDVVTVRRMAMLSGQAGLALRAASAGRETILSLVGLLGVEQADVADALRLGETISRALVAATRTDPAIGHAVAATLRTRGALVVAAELTAIANSVSKNREKVLADDYAD